MGESVKDLSFWIIGGKPWKAKVNIHITLSVLGTFLTKVLSASPMYTTDGCS